ncbi:hypothetical protein PGT21_010980 [Puccinia graminis f. sp. tritici]|uniref:Intradiol ring-cleavage dioxygenases domain-containing protein n=1 Tax=Puccinia graminis f. sp. tritici TaxID=56615 RepID=A0A5B0M6D5_PUCGR|nr:hypothetical protein PGTUg99_028398 [Puccinia graminis f. sp. tritici]KAA1071540.1 hypothetical protein PGT21_010980 [Puccinia graminis f. sp. tritici]
MSGKEWMSAAVLEAEKNGFTDVNNVLANLPSIGEQNVDSITDNTILINNQCPSPRMKFVMAKLIQHLHSFAKEVDLQTDEWQAGIRFLTETGQKCSDVRQEFILLSDILGFSALVDGLSNCKPPGCTESTVLGPFHTEDAPQTEQGGSIVSTSGGRKMVVEGAVKNQKGEGIAGAQLDVWETDENGFYDVQNADRSGPDNRGIITTDDSGKYRFEAIVPMAYPIPTDGPVSGLLKKLHRHCFRPAHIHFMIKAKGYEALTTSLYIKGDPFISSDAVFGVKNSLVVDVSENSPDASHPTKWWSLKYDFTLPTEQEANTFKSSRRNEVLGS